MFNEIDLLIFDFDGVITDGTYYTKDSHKHQKKISDLEWTALKMFRAQNIPIICVTGDPWNQEILKSRKIDYYSSLDSNGILSKEKILGGFNRKNVAFVGDDLFDLNLMKLVKYPFCPANGSLIVKNYLMNRYRIVSEESNPHILKRNSGCGVIEEIYLKFFGYPTSDIIERMKVIDKLERQ